MGGWGGGGGGRRREERWGGGGEGGWGPGGWGGGQSLLRGLANPALNTAAFTEKATRRSEEMEAEGRTGEP